MLQCRGCRQSLFGAVRYCPYCGDAVATGGAGVAAATSNRDESVDGTTSDRAERREPVVVVDVASGEPGSAAAVASSVQTPVAIDSAGGATGSGIAIPATVEPPAKPVEHAPPARPTAKRWAAALLLLGLGIGAGGLLWENIRTSETGSVARRSQSASPTTEPAPRPGNTKSRSEPSPERAPAPTETVTARPAPKRPESPPQVPPTGVVPSPSPGPPTSTPDAEPRRRDLADAIRMTLTANNVPGVVATVDRDGRVTLSGVVERAPDRERALALVRVVPGVSRVTSAVRVRTEELKAEIAAGIRQALERNGIRGVEVIVRDDNGVILRGPVDSQPAGDLAMSLAWNYPGVRGVTPELTVREP